MLKRSAAAVILAAMACAPAQAAAPTANPAIAARIKADVAEIIAGINAKDIARATKYDAPDLVSMESMREPSYGAKADHDGLSMAFKYSPELASPPDRRNGRRRELWGHGGLPIDLQRGQPARPRAVHAQSQLPRRLPPRSGWNVAGALVGGLRSIAVEEEDIAASVVRCVSRDLGQRDCFPPPAACAKSRPRGSTGGRACAFAHR